MLKTRIVAILLIAMLLMLGACTVPSASPMPTPEPTPAPTPTPTPPPAPAPTPEPMPPAEPQPSSSNSTSLNIEDKDQYATILELSDSKGNVVVHSEHNGRTFTYCEPVVKVGEPLTIKVEVYNSIADPVSYIFVGHGFPNTWQDKNEVTITITDYLQTIHLRVFVKNADERYRAPDYDDMIQISYKIEGF